MTRFTRTVPALLLAVCLLVFGAFPGAVAAQTDTDTDTDTDTAADVSPSGFAVTDEAIHAYYAQHGGSATFGDPISRSFVWQGKPSQLFQRALLQVQPDGSVQPANLLGQSFLPFTHFNGLTVPAADRALAFVTPTPGQPQYGARLLEFVRATVPDIWQGMPVNFETTLFSSLTCDQAFPGAACSPDALALASVELWGAPTSAPAADPRNPNFVYQRFERGVLMYDAVANTTQWLPLGESLKALLTTQNLPDLAADATTAASPLLHPTSLPNTDLTDAFTPDA